MQSQVTYSEIKTFTYPNAIVRVYIPDLAQEEKQRRLKQIHNAAEKLLKEKKNVEY